ncbi:Splicing factor 3B subunit 2 [Perkinsus olseni]|uniref:Splicing factor 3B subunit 2 n=1 Tax=Perkinsus olseni TaxID=32597 RepID=A0A7J6Q8N5_PEROL|nr:Splicing factor 3B subunit 2 [Perkinsus olseni]
MVALTAAQREERTRVKRALKRKEARKRRREVKAVEAKHKEEEKTTPSDTVDDDQVDIEYTVHTLPEEFKAAYYKRSLAN